MTPVAGAGADALGAGAGLLLLLAGDGPLVDPMGAELEPPGAAVPFAARDQPARRRIQAADWGVGENPLRVDRRSCYLCRAKRLCET